MSLKAVSWTLLATIALAAVLLLNYWASYQPLSTLAYTGIVAALCGLANVVLPFRFLGIRKRAIGALVLAAGVTLAFAALLWPAPTIRVVQHRTVLDDALPEYHFFERHSTRVHARPEQVMLAIRQSTFGDMRSLSTLLKIRGVALRAPSSADMDLQNKRIFDSFSEAGYLSAENPRELVMVGVWNARENRRPDVHTLPEVASYREQGGVKMGFGFAIEDAGGGWCTLQAETRVHAVDDLTRSGMGRYWRLIVPGSGLLRRQWLEGIKKRAESAPSVAS